MIQRKKNPVANYKNNFIKKNFIIIIILKRNKIFKATIIFISKRENILYFENIWFCNNIN